MLLVLAKAVERRERKATAMMESIAKDVDGFDEARRRGKGMEKVWKRGWRGNAT